MFSSDATSNDRRLPVPDIAVMPLDVRQAKFATAMRGYDRQEVAKMIAEEVPVGSAESTLLEFYRKRGWQPTYDRFKHAYFLKIADDKDRHHVIVVEVRLNKERSVKEVRVFDVYK
jgi:DivIVA domain-containing protein